MRLLIIVYALVLTSFAFGKAELPAIAVAESVVDAGTVEQGDPLKHIFTFENKGTGELRILGVEHS